MLCNEVGFHKRLSRSKSSWLELYPASLPRKRFWGGTKYELLKNACVGGYIRTSSNKQSVEFYDLLKTDMVLIPLTTLSQKV